jgi:beta-1,4-mannosyl-glycoprotein beta-1,4-N-acetylglucosaminyltransferase
MIVDVFPFFNELDVLDIRLHELAPVVDRFVILECKETYGGDLKPLYLQSNWSRYAKFADKITHVITDRINPPLGPSLLVDVPGIKAADIRTLGRLREKNQREDLLPVLQSLGLNNYDVISFGDCDEIPKADAFIRFAFMGKDIARLKQHTFYYNVNTEIDYGRDVCSRARIGTWGLLKSLGSMYDFRMYGNKGAPYTIPALEEGGWHFSYFGGDVTKLHEKVNALNPFLAEYKLFGDGQLVTDILNRKDLHRRPLTFSELPETFTERASDDPALPAYYLNNLDKFKHFTREHFARKYGR